MNLDWNTTKRASPSASKRCEGKPVYWHTLPAIGVIGTGTDLVAVADRTGKLTFVSDCAESVLGLSPRFLVGRSLLDLVPPEDWAELQGVIEQAMKSESPICARVRLLDACGVPHACESSVKNKLSDPFVWGFMLTFREFE